MLYFLQFFFYNRDMNLIEYSKEDYYFIDENGNKYISTPEFDWSDSVSFILLFSFSSLIFVSTVFIYSFK